MKVLLFLDIEPGLGGVDGDGVGFLLQVAELVAMAVAYAAGHGGYAFPEGFVDGVLGG